ncbi:MAG: winged helix-turn-helix transcriptional regulator, partial [Pseudonocardia sp.]|nr:winged helix-turn-helix transcriptional regulator [Pseudonocardia sp.]
MNGDWSDLDRRAAVHSALGDPGRLAIVDALTLGDVSPSALQEALGMASNLLAHHVKVLERAGVVRRVRSEGDRRRSYLSVVPDALTGLNPAASIAAARVVFVCTENAAR